MKVIKDRFISNRKYSNFFMILILIFVLGCVSLGIRPTRLMLCWLTSNEEEQILHSIPNPDGAYTLHVVKVNCGQSSYNGIIYPCSIRLDLEVKSQDVEYTVKGREFLGECDATIQWLDDIQFEMTSESGDKRILNVMDDFGILIVNLWFQRTIS